MSNKMSVKEAIQCASDFLRIDGRIYQAQQLDESASALFDAIEALNMAREELSGLPHSLGYSFTHLPKIDAALARVKEN